MEVKIEMIPKMNSNIDFAQQVKAITESLIRTCSLYGVTELNYIHDYFKIHIEQPETIIQQDIPPLYQHEDKGE